MQYTATKEKKMLLQKILIILNVKYMLFISL